MNGCKYELHSHTNEVSICANVNAERLVAEYENAGYTGVVITNHMNLYTFLNKGPVSWEEKVDYFLKGYHLAQNAAGDRLQIFLGMEITFYDCDNDYLVYGFDEDFLYHNGDLMAMGIHQFSALAHRQGLMIYQAHPFRNRMTITDPGLLDGIETHNGNPRHDSRNDVAELWAEKYGLHRSSGSDYHELEDLGRGGILLPRKIETIHDIIAFLQNDQAVLLTGSACDHA